MQNSLACDTTLELDNVIVPNIRMCRVTFIGMSTVVHLFALVFIDFDLIMGVTVTGINILDQQELHQ
jgi:hypothetical protein